MPALHITASAQFAPWLLARHAALAFSAYHNGKLFLLGVNPAGQLALFERSFDRCMGLCCHGDDLWLATAFQLHRCHDVGATGEDGVDRLYVPRLAYITGDIDIHDLAVDGEGRALFVVTLFNCLGTPSPTHSFRPLWRPPFISRLSAGDRCHLNGLALRDGQATYATAVAASDEIKGWRTRRRDGGVVVDVAGGEILARGLSMPHSPRWHAGRLWLLDSGNARLGYLDGERFRPVAFCPGYARGLAILDNHAVVGLSRPRQASLRGLALEEELTRHSAAPQCGLMVVDLDTGETVQWLRLDGVDELYDVALIPDCRRPQMLGFRTDEIRYTVTVEGSGSVWRGAPRPNG